MNEEQKCLIQFFKTASFLMFGFPLLSCASTVQEGKPVPPELRAKAIDFQNKKAYCARTAKTDVEFSECLGVDWETLKTDQTGIH